MCSDLIVDELGNYIITDPKQFDFKYKINIGDKILEKPYFKTNTKITWNCKKCGKKVIVKFRKTNIDNYKPLLCNDHLRLMRYGFVSPFQNVEIRENLKKKFLEKYGVEHPLQSQEIHDKISENNLKKYGNKCTLHDNGKIENSVTELFLEKYGVEHPLQNKDILNATKITMINKYGEISPLKIPEFKLKAENTTMKHYGVKNIFSSLDFHKESDKKKLDKYGNKNNYKRAVKTRILRYGRNLNNMRYNYYNAYFDSSWELSVWIYCIDNDIPIVRNPCAFEYIDNKGELHNYEVDFKINGKLVEIKGDQYFNLDGSMKYCHNTEKMGATFVKLTPERKKYKDDLYERKHQCGLANGVEFWREKDCLKYIEYCNTKYPGWNTLYRKDNPYNPSYWCGFIFNPGYYQRPMYYLLSNKGITPFDCNSKSQYTEITGKGLTPFDIKL